MFTLPILQKFLEKLPKLYGGEGLKQGKHPLNLVLGASVRKEGNLCLLNTLCSLLAYETSGIFQLMLQSLFLLYSAAVPNTAQYALLIGM